VSSATQLSFDVVVIGAGPAGLAAAVSAAQHSRRVALLDDNPRPGGQIWRHGIGTSNSPDAKYWFEALAKSNVQVISGARVFGAERMFLEAETNDGILQIEFGRLVLATGARELFLPFPGWTLPNVMGAGGLQALAKSGLPVAGKRIVLAGTGPLLLAVAAYLAKHDAELLYICEQAAFASLARFAATIASFPRKAWEGLRLRYASRPAKYCLQSWPVEALGDKQLEAVRIFQESQIREVPCDYLACGYHLIPNIELAQMLGCHIHEGFIATNELQETSLTGIFCAGEPTGIGGMELSVIEGRIAGHVAAGAPESAKKFFSQRARYRQLAVAMKQAFRLRPELAKLAKADTLLCRCEDIPMQHVQKHDSWRAAKLHTRCGMGPCQGRVCGAATQFLFGWKVDWNRPPVFPVRCVSLATERGTEVEEFQGGRP
jgi:D-hydroxyproline dehydrogenase subunit alpha